MRVILYVLCAFGIFPPFLVCCMYILGKLWQPCRYLGTWKRGHTMPSIFKRPRFFSWMDQLIDWFTSQKSKPCAYRKISILCTYAHMYMCICSEAMLFLRPLPLFLTDNTYREFLWQQFCKKKHYFPLKPHTLEGRKSKTSVTEEGLTKCYFL
jgi:hypothetical protein